MRAAPLLLLAFLCAFLAGESEGQAPPKPGGRSAELIVGKWVLSDMERGPTFEYTSDGALKMVLGPELPTRTGKYTFQDGGSMTVEWEDARDPAKKTHKLKVTVTTDELTTTDEKGTVSRFTRAK